ncbi:MAG: hypothetical protein J6W47_00335 [Bacteroidales bacterium]|nr:hypothetical protein [Bacteroidales bacterium]
MKKTALTLMLVIISMTQLFAMSNASIRRHARFLTDRMAYELDLTPRQYDDIFEINYDFIYMADRIMDDVVYGYRDAIEHYYDLLDIRNDDLHYVLTSRQYRRFIDCEYFYRPIYTNNSRWYFRVYTVYHNRKFFYYDAPAHYMHYKGEHSRHHYGKPDFYADRYHQHAKDRYDGAFRIQQNKDRHDVFRKNDFGTNIRERNDAEQNRINNYSNRNSQNRTENRYYQDNSGNKNAQEINTRNQTNGSTRKQSSTSSGSRSTTSSSSSTGSTTRNAVNSSGSSSSSTSNSTSTGTGTTTRSTTSGSSSSTRSSSGSSTSTRNATTNSGSSTRSTTRR